MLPAAAAIQECSYSEAIIESGKLATTVTQAPSSWFYFPDSSSIILQHRIAETSWEANSHKQATKEKVRKQFLASISCLNKQHRTMSLTPCVLYMSVQSAGFSDLVAKVEALNLEEQAVREELYRIDALAERWEYLNQHPEVTAHFHDAKIPEPRPLRFRSLDAQANHWRTCKGELAERFRLLKEDVRSVEQDIAGLKSQSSWSYSAYGRPFGNTLFESEHLRLQMVVLRAYVDDLGKKVEAMMRAS